MDFGRQLGKRMRRARIERGITQSELAQSAGVGANYVPRLERGEMVPSVEAAYCIARALGVSLDTLCGRPSRHDAENLASALAHLSRADAALLRRVADAIDMIGPRSKAKARRRK